MHMNIEFIPWFLMEVHICKRILNVHTEDVSVPVSNNNTKAFWLITKHFHVHQSKHFHVYHKRDSDFPNEMEPM